MPHPSPVRPRTVVVAALATGLLLPAAASAAWTPATEVDTDAGVSSLTVDGAGNRLVIGRKAAKGGAVDSRLVGITAAPKPDGLRTLKGVQTAPVALDEDELVFPRTKSMGTVRRTVPDGKGGTKSVSLTRYRLGVSVGAAPNAALGTLRSHGTAVLDEAPRFSGVANGNLAMGWSEVGDDGVVRVYAAWRRASTKAAVRLGTPKLISGSRSSRLLAMATGAGGKTVLVYQQGASEKTRKLFVRSLDVRTGKLSKIQTLRRGGPGFPIVAAAVGSGGRAVIAWGEQDAATERTKPFVVRATTRDSDKGRFAVPKPIDTGTAAVRAPGGAVVAAVDGQNRATVAWNQTVGSVADGTAHDIPRVAESEATGGLGAVRDLAAAGRVHDVAVAGPTTGVVLVREQERPLGGSNGDRGVAVQAAFRPAGGALGAPETIEAFTDAQLLDRSNAFGAAAIGALPDGRFSVAWTRATVAGDKLRSSTLFSDRTTAP
ncbi:hypothetical protein [Patulibacter sp. SYSU D01012]|uniref:hypothetical protein n=1 Tax=Patulibacter sp. SYSU D01012 TaxID=2817381 RepID=UPI001B30228D|nr:hypothetical protein [Patulibacter sp. SYSU D01012]